MSATLLHLLTDAEGVVLDGDEEALALLGERAGRPCRQVVEACAPGGAPVCTATCAGSLEGRAEHGVVRARGRAFRLTCTALADRRVITLVPLPQAALQDEALSPRERQVLAEVARGLTNDQVARRLGISASTVRTHLEHILTKLGVRSRAAAAARALAAGLIEG